MKDMFCDNWWFYYFTCRGRSVNKRFTGACFVLSKMAGIDGTTAVSDARTGNMIFEPILEEGIFRFDCSADDRNAAFPSFSFVDPKVRETPIMSIHKVPSYIPTFECVMGQQIVNIEVILLGPGSSLHLPFMLIIKKFWLSLMKIISIQLSFHQVPHSMELGRLVVSSKEQGKGWVSKTILLIKIFSICSSTLS